LSNHRKMTGVFDPVYQPGRQTLYHVWDCQLFFGTLSV
jgi:hypothetical protein